MFKEYSTAILLSILITLYLVVNNQSFLLREPVLDESKNTIMIAAIFFTMAFFVFATTMYYLFLRAAKQKLSPEIFTGKPVSNILLGTAIVFFLGFVVITSVNRKFDRSEPEKRIVKIISLEEKGKLVKVRVNTWNKGKIAETILLDRRFFSALADKMTVGKEVEIETKKGAFSIERISSLKLK